MGNSLSVNSHITTAKQRINITDLFVQCPFKRAHDGCPAIKYRKMSNKNRMKAIKKMDDDKLQRIMKYHKICYQIRCEL